MIESDDTDQVLYAGFSKESAKTYIENFEKYLEELKRDHSGIPHGGFVFRSGSTGMNDEFNNVIEYSLKLDSNPAFTSSVLVAYARAVYRMSGEGRTGCVTVLDVPPAYICAQSGEELRRHML